MCTTAHSHKPWTDEGGHVSITGVRYNAAYGFVGLGLDGSACSFGAMQWSI